MPCEMHMFSFFPYICNYILSSYIPVGFIFIPGQAIIQKNNLFSKRRTRVTDCDGVYLFQREFRHIGGKFSPERVKPAAISHRCSVITQSPGRSRGVVRHGGMPPGETRQCDAVAHVRRQ